MKTWSECFFLGNGVIFGVFLRLVSQDRAHWFHWWFVMGLVSAAWLLVDAAVIFLVKPLLLRRKKARA